MDITDAWFENLSATTVDAKTHEFQAQQHFRRRVAKTKVPGRKEVI
jgi:hypothetical protein